MRKLILALLAGTLTAGFAAPAFSQSMVNPSTGMSYYTDDAQIGSWAIPSVDQLQLQGVMTGYPDGSFRPKANITREEFAVALDQAMLVLENRLYQAMMMNDQDLYDMLVDQQMQILDIADRQNMMSKMTGRNWVGLAIGYVTEGGNSDDNAYISLDGRFRVLKLSNDLTVSVRPMVNTTGEAGASATVDYQLTEKISVGAGAGVVGSWSDSSALAGDDEVAGYGTLVGEYSVSDKGVVYLQSDVPFTGDNSGDISVKAGFGIKF